MAHSVQDASQHLQAVSEATNSANSSELRAIVEHNKELSNGLEKAPSSNDTNPFTTSELRANIKFHKQTNHPADVQEPLSSCSGVTNPFTSGEFKAILKRHEYKTRSSRKIGTRHPALQGPILEPGRPSKRDGSVHQGDPSKQVRVVDNGKPTRLVRIVDHDESSKQARVLERGESSKQGSRASAEVKRQRRTTHDTTANNTKRGTRQTSPSTICRQSITRAILQLGTESPININTETIGMSRKYVLHTTREVTLTQSQHDFGIKLHIPNLHSDQTQYDPKGPSKPFELDFYFDPNSDFVLLINKTLFFTEQSLVIKQLPISPGKIPTTLDYLEKTALGPFSYRLFVSDRQVFDITVLPRRYIALSSGPCGQVRKSVKRTTFDMLSQHADPPTAKRVKEKETNTEWEKTGVYINDQSKGKEKETNNKSKAKGKGKGKTTSDASHAKETTDGSNASTIVQTWPPSNDLIPAVASPFPSSSNMRAGYVSAKKHPLEELQQNATIKIANASREEDYTLVHKDKIANQENTLVFKAHHSKIPGRPVAVKVWRSTFDPTLNLSADVRFISNVSQYFLNELKNHLKVSEHPTIASLFSFDVRLLALYIEHIDAPTLAFYRNPGGNPYCTLKNSDAERVLHGIAGALKFIHGKDIVHNDIKPANILYSKERGPVLIDFGWSSDTKTVHTAGSPWYIPPEYQQIGTRGPAGDVFAFGVVMLFLMRKIPLPELLTPRLRWQIHHLRSKRPEALEANEAMNKWLQIIEESLDKFLGINDDECGEILEAIVPRLVKFKVKHRLTGDEILQQLQRTPR